MRLKRSRTARPRNVQTSGSSALPCGRYVSRGSQIWRVRACVVALTARSFSASTEGFRFAGRRQIFASYARSSTARSPHIRRFHGVGGASLQVPVRTLHVTQSHLSYISFRICTHLPPRVRFSCFRRCRRTCSSISPPHRIVLPH